MHVKRFRKFIIQQRPLTCESISDKYAIARPIQSKRKKTITKLYIDFGISCQCQMRIMQKDLFELIHSLRCRTQSPWGSGSTKNCWTPNTAVCLLWPWYPDKVRGHEPNFSIKSENNKFCSSWGKPSASPPLVNSLQTPGYINPRYRRKAQKISPFMSAKKLEFYLNSIYSLFFSLNAFTLARATVQRGRHAIKAV